MSQSKRKISRLSVSLHVPGSGWGRAPLVKEAGLLRVLRMGGVSSWAVGAGGWGHCGSSVKQEVITERLCQAPWEKGGWLIAFAWHWCELGARP